MGIASALVNVADKVIGKFGGDVTIRVVTPGSYNAETSEVREGISDTEVKGIIEDVVSKEVNELIRAGDKTLRVTVAAKDLASAPSTVDRVLINNVVHSIISVKTNEQENTAITYELTLKV